MVMSVTYVVAVFKPLPLFLQMSSEKKGGIKMDKGSHLPDNSRESRTSTNNDKPPEEPSVVRKRGWPKGVPRGPKGTPKSAPKGVPRGPKNSSRGRGRGHGGSSRRPPGRPPKVRKYELQNLLFAKLLCSILHMLLCYRTFGLMLLHDYKGRWCQCSSCIEVSCC